MNSIKQTSTLFLLLVFCLMNAASAQESYILNYDNVEVKKVTQDIARFAKKTIILDPRVKGRVTIFSNAALDQDQVWQVYLRTMQVNGFSSITEDGNIVRDVPIIACQMRSEFHDDNIIILMFYSEYHKGHYFLKKFLLAHQNLGFPD